MRFPSEEASMTSDEFRLLEYEGITTCKRLNDATIWFLRQEVEIFVKFYV